MTERATEARPAGGAGVHELGRAVDHPDRVRVRLLGAVAPNDQAVLREDDQPQRRILADGGANLLGEGEARPYVRDPGGLVAEALPHEPLAVSRPREDVDRVGVRVVHVGRRDEGVQQRLDR